MDEAVNPASIAVSISIGLSLLAGLGSVLVALRSRKAANGHRDTFVSILAGIALLLTCLNMTAAAVIAAWGVAYIGMLEAALLLTGAFALVGMVIGLMRGLRSGRPIKTQGNFDWLSRTRRQR